MNYYPPKPPQVTYIIEKPFIEIAKKDCATNDYAQKQREPLEQTDWGGYPFSSIGTIASGTSLSIVHTTELNFVPNQGIVPQYFMEEQQIVYNLEQIVNPISNRG